jgi:hypothetical protein
MLAHINFSKDLVYQTSIALLLFIIGFLFVFEGSFFTETQKSDITNMRGGTYIRLVYIGSSGCSFSNNKRTHQMVKSIKKFTKDFVHQEGYKFLSTGIAQDKLAFQGINFLQKSGPYDEIIAGGSWYNLGLFQYVWDTLPGIALTPQILLTLSEFRIVSAGEQIGNIKRNEILLKRFKGIKAIENLQKVVEENDLNKFKKTINLESKIDSLLSVNL